MYSLIWRNARATKSGPATIRVVKPDLVGAKKAERMVWKEVVPQSILKLTVFEKDPAAGK